MGMLSKGKTQYINIRNFPQNTDLVVRYVYDNPAPSADDGEDVADARAVNVELQHSIIQVPKNNGLS